jgi:GrpB-like predicted nucleotidyltransferase (UPF0157 family)
MGSLNYTPIEVRPADPSWPQEFSRRADVLRDALEAVAVRIDHIGSTAVPGLAAKPTIDIQVVVSDVEDLDAYRPTLERLGYTFHSHSLCDADHRFFSSPGRVVHVHVCNAGSGWERDHLLFRDFLRAAPEVAADYEALKYRLAREHTGDRVAYAEAKGVFVTHALADAEDWATKTGWSL